ncbi:tumor necrosis factor receptor superfamily member 10B-like isoform X2 [Nannospalax galili]|uniref:tumor necrosis factor receptor superfamily member 10B-like isoform X2 n=1 Tax=Nannospalax galili TaxID=1026970 RepID=UPI00111C2FA1|nr:tumor necrosis factor receptor superfamily member 10B-like isoform X2 [Nannospalax galili]
MERSLNSTEPQSVLAASAALAGRIPDPRPARGPGPRPPVCKNLKFPVVGFLLLNLFVPVTTSPIPHVQGLEQNATERLCPAGQYLEEDGRCKPCEDGVGFTSYPNNLKSCIPCKICKDGTEPRGRPADQVQKSQCTTTRNTECECKPGTFRGKQDPEHCRKCTVNAGQKGWLSHHIWPTATSWNLIISSLCVLRCANNETEEISCTPWGDRKCKKSYTNTTGPSPNTSQETYILWLFIVLSVVLIIALVVLFIWKTQVWKKICGFMKSTCPGHGPDSACMNSMRLSTLNSQTSGSGTGSHDNTVTPAVEGPAEAESSPTGGELEEVKVTLLKV